MIYNIKIKNKKLISGTEYVIRHAVDHSVGCWRVYNNIYYSKINIASNKQIQVF